MNDLELLAQLENELGFTIPYFGIDAYEYHPMYESLQSNNVGYTKPDDGSNTIVGINLYGSNLTEFPSSLFNFKNLELLYLNNNKIKLLPDNIYKLKKLKELHINNNQLEIISDDLTSLPSLVELYLSGNNLITIPSNLHKLSYLKILNLKDNRLTEMPTNLPKLETLNIGKNNIEQLSEDKVNLPRVTHLYCDNNPIKHIPHRFFVYLKNLVNLKITDTKLKEVPHGLHKLSNLVKVDLSSNEIEYIYPDLFSHSDTLVVLNLHKNKLTTLPKTIANTNLKIRYMNNIERGISVGNNNFSDDWITNIKHSKKALVEFIRNH